MNKEFGKNTLYSVAGFGVMMICSFVFNYFVARKLGVTDYGVFMAFFYFLITFTQPINSLQLAVAKKTAGENLNTGEAVKAISPTIFLIGLIVLAAFAAMSPMLVRIYHLPGLLDAILGGAVVAAWLYLGGYRGVYQGGMKFLSYGANYAIEGLVRAAVGVGLIFAGFGIGAAIGSSLAGAVIAVAVLIIPFLGHAFSKVSLKPDGKLIGEFLKALFVLFPFGLIMNLDLTMVQNVIGGEPAGYVSACALFGKNLVALSMMIANVVFSYTVRRSSKVFWSGLALIAGVFVVAALGVIPVSGWLVSFLFGPGFEPVAKLLPLVIIATMPVGILQHIANNAIAAEDKRVMPGFLILLVALVVEYWFVLKVLPLETFYLISMGTIALADAALLFLHRKKLQTEL